MYNETVKWSQGDRRLPRKGITKMRWRKDEVVLLAAIGVGVLAVIGVTVFVVRKFMKRRRLRRAVEEYALAQMQASGAKL